MNDYKCKNMDLLSFFPSYVISITTATTTNTTMANTDNNMDYGRDAPFVKTVQFLPSIFAFSLGEVKDLRESLGIPQKYADDNLVTQMNWLHK